MIFDGKAFASEIEAQVRDKVAKLAKKPKIVSIVVGDEAASALYTKLKKAAAERVGIEFEVQKYTNAQVHEIKDLIAKIGERGDVSGVMVQLPIPGISPRETKEILQAIPLAKDVDGLRWEESGIMPATVKAIFRILDKIAKDTGKKIYDLRFVVVGAGGIVGRPLVHFLHERNTDVSEVEWNTPKDESMHKCMNAEVLISCVGKAGIVSGKIVREGLIAIDVGQPVGDMTKEVYRKASVAVPVPNGVGPVTIASLLNNSVELDDTNL